MRDPRKYVAQLSLIVNPVGGRLSLEDGYEFVFPGGAEWATEVVRFVLLERECCPFFTFELVFEPHGGPISVRMRGPEGAKELIEEQPPERS